MPEIKAWEKRITGINNIDDLEEREQAARFNGHIHHLLKVIPKDSRPALIDLLDTLNVLYTDAVIKNWKDGYRHGIKDGYETGIVALDRIVQSAEILKRGIKEINPPLLQRMEASSF